MEGDTDTDTDADSDTDADGDSDADSDTDSDSDADGDSDADSDADTDIDPLDQDDDGDGFTENEGDCDDTDGSINPDATETWYDGVDQDCDGASDYDQDGDGYDHRGYGGTDCDDTNPWINPGATETWYNGVDEDCSGGSDYDRDGDGYDSDSYGGADCDDFDRFVNPGMPETWYDGTDTDCDGASDFDQDGDGHDSDSYGGDDCRDTDTTAYPGALSTIGTIDVAFVCGGTFTMGSPTSEVGRRSGSGYGEAQHSVTLTRDYYISVTEITHDEFYTYTGYRATNYTGCGNCPVAASWHQAAVFAYYLSSALSATTCHTCNYYSSSADCELDSAFSDPYQCNGARLPTSAEWEYAARAGSGAAFSDGGNLNKGDDSDCTGTLALDSGTLLDDLAWYCGNASSISAVAGLDPNAWGLYDIHGNLQEWTEDGGPCQDYSSSAETDPWESSCYDKSVRGGSYSSYPKNCRLAARGGASEGSSNGFRIVKEAP